MAHRHFESEEARQVGFSKHIVMLFKEVSELSIMCGAEVAAVVFSPTGKAFSFGHPSVEAILERFAPTRAAAEGGGCAHTGKDNKKLAELKKEYKELRAHLNAEKARKVRVEAAMAKERAVGSLGVAWLEADVRDLGEEDLISYAKVLAEVLAIIPRSANHSHTMPARARSSNNIQMQQPPQQFLMNNGIGFVDSFGVGSTNNNNGVEMTITPAPGFGFDGPY